MALYNVKAGPTGVWITRTSVGPTIECRLLAERPWGDAEKRLKQRGMTLNDLARHVMTQDATVEMICEAANG